MHNTYINYLFILPRFLGINVLLSNNGICSEINLPPLSSYELERMDVAVSNIKLREELAMEWYQENLQNESEMCKIAAKTNFFGQANYVSIQDCKSQIST